MPASNPLTAVDDLVTAAFTLHGDVMSLIQNIRKVQDFSQRFNTFRLESASHAGYRMWIISPNTRPNFRHTNSSYRFVLEYQIGVAAGTEKREDIRKIEYASYKAIANLCERKTATGAPISDATIQPFIFDGADSSDFDMEEDAFGVVQEFKGIAKLSVAVIVPKSSMVAA